MVDRREGGQHRVLPLIVQAPGRQNGPRRLAPALPANLEFVHRTEIGQLLEEARAHRRVQPDRPRIDRSAAEPGLRRRIRVEHLVAGNGRDHQRDRYRGDQIALRLRRARVGCEFLLDAALAVELRQHVVEAEHQSADLVAAVPVRAQGVVAGAAHGVDHARQPAQRHRDLARDVEHRRQYQQQQRQRGAQVQPHAGEKALFAHFQKVFEFRTGLRPGKVEIGEKRLLCDAEGRKFRRGGCAVGVVGAVAGLQHGTRCQPETGDADVQPEARGVEPLLQRPRRSGKGFAVIALDAGCDGVDPAFEDEVLGAGLGRGQPGSDRRPKPCIHRRAQVQQFRKAQQHQRHRVVAVEIGIEDQVRLVAHARHQRPAAFERGTVRRDAVDRARGLRPCECLAELPAALGALQAVAALLLEHFDLRGRCQRCRAPAGQCHQRRAQLADVGRACHLLATEVDRDEFFVDQDAADEDHCREIEQIDDQQLAPDTEPAEPTGNELQHVEYVVSKS